MINRQSSTHPPPVELRWREAELRFASTAQTKAG